jgi:hypothetical protein
MSVRALVITACPRSALPSRGSATAATGTTHAAKTERSLRLSWWIRAPRRIWCIPVQHAKSESVRLGRRLVVEATMPPIAVATVHLAPRLWSIWACGRTLCTIVPQILPQAPILHEKRP